MRLLLCFVWHNGKDAAGTGKSAWRYGRGCGHRRGFLFQGFNQNALQATGIDQVYGERPLTSRIEASWGVAFAQPQYLLRLAQF
jgi:hypothetical protein